MSNYVEKVASCAEHGPQGVIGMTTADVDARRARGEREMLCCECWRWAWVPPHLVYPLDGTCDVCAQGDRPLRVLDPDTEAWGCAECDADHERGVAAAAHAMEVAHETARAGVDAYFKETNPPPAASSPAHRNREGRG